MTTTDEELVRRALKASLPTPTPASLPSSDLWPRVAARLHARRRMSRVDWSLAAAIVLALLVVPKWLWLIAYHL